MWDKRPTHGIKRVPYQFFYIFLLLPRWVIWVLKKLKVSGPIDSSERHGIIYIELFSLDFLNKKQFINL